MAVAVLLAMGLTDGEVGHHRVFSNGSNGVAKTRQLEVETLDGFDGCGGRPYSITCSYWRVDMTMLEMGEPVPAVVYVKTMTPGMGHQVRLTRRRAG
jgi:hypothetical protein